MPSRKVATEPKQKQENKVKQAKQAKPKPTVTVTDDSSPEEKLHSSWLFINTFQFFHTFRAYFRLPLFDIEKLETGLLKEQDDFIETFLVQVISPFLGPEQKKKISIFNFERYLRATFPEYFSEETVSFYQLDMMEKINLLKAIEDRTVDLQTEQFQAWKAESSSDDLRVEPLGTDSEGWTYWYFGDSRLYREVPIPKGKRGKDFLDTNAFTFELVCSNKEEWDKITEKFQSLKRTNALATEIIDISATILSRMEAREAARVRNEAKLKRAQELELLPKKRSRRLEVKYDEQAKRQKIQDDIKQQELFEEYERKKVKEQAQLEEIERKKIKEQEQEHIRINVDNLKEQVRDYIEKQIEVDDSLKELESKLSKTARESVRVRRMQGWISLFKNKIEFNKDDFIILSDNENVLSEPLVKNTLRVFLTTLGARLESKHPINTIYTNLMLDKFENLQEFNTALDQATVQDAILRDRASRLLYSILNEPYV
ncbi:hypothetical protein K501DRAFT_332858 [Backusella circina FSU 941]|nr:hypothetical protein K501DRAFT_332858 [Backusella circina FSU 941]